MEISYGTIGSKIVHEIHRDRYGCIVLCMWATTDYYPKYKKTAGPVTCKRCLIHRDKYMPCLDNGNGKETHVKRSA